jgi:chemotaxis protein MotA
MGNMNLLYEGVMSIREGEHPRLLEDKLNVYLTDGSKGKGKEKAAPEANSEG